jgi:hypothetical protein
MLTTNYQLERERNEGESEGLLDVTRLFLLRGTVFDAGGFIGFVFLYVSMCCMFARFLIIGKNESRHCRVVLVVNEKKNRRTCLILKKGREYTITSLP